LGRKLAEGAPHLAEMWVSAVGRSRRAAVHSDSISTVPGRPNLTVLLRKGLRVPHISQRCGFHQLRAPGARPSTQTRFQLRLGGPYLTVLLRKGLRVPHISQRCGFRQLRAPGARPSTQTRFQLCLGGPYLTVLFRKGLRVPHISQRCGFHQSRASGARPSTQTRFQLCPRVHSDDAGSWTRASPRAC